MRFLFLLSTKAAVVQKREQQLLLRFQLIDLPLIFCIISNAPLGRIADTNQ